MTPPQPQASPTPTPGPLSVMPQSISLSAPGATQTYAATESTYAGAFHSSADSSCANIASVNPSAVTTSPATFTVTAGSKAGTCSITVGDASGQTKTVTVTVTLTQGTIQ